MKKNKNDFYRYKRLFTKFRDKKISENLIIYINKSLSSEAFYIKIYDLKNRKVLNKWRLACHPSRHSYEGWEVAFNQDYSYLDYDCIYWLYRKLCIYIKKPHWILDFNLKS